MQSVGVCNITELTSCTPSSVGSVAMDKSQGELSLLGGDGSANADYGVPIIIAIYNTFVVMRSGAVCVYIVALHSAGLCRA